MACVSAIKNERPLYKACPNESCNNKKMFDQDAGDYYLCEKCISLTKNFKWYPHIQAKLADYSGEQWITCFGEQAERLIGVPANTLGELYEASGPSDSRLEDTLEDVTFKKFIFRLHTKKDVYNWVPGGGGNLCLLLSLEGREDEKKKDMNRITI
ncbi:replication protein A 70 kDa DNA-binding subunit-like [Dermacentor silvarum]|uniref:replication protein A 70 kDa DNA-binding subunit-like n=1 Tax=Dermacentor silvarum TaxID=543639 RepID=UPI002101864D|nr:replication protein A 70 kDa DNA-binding subunit-like [Dermacentor silvarum]